MGRSEMILTDTCVIIWNALKPNALTSKVLKVLKQANEGEGIYFSEWSLWEIAMLMKKGRLDPGTDYAAFIKLLFDSNNYVLTGINAEIASRAVHLPDTVNQDPMDRILIATALYHQCPLVTGDRNILQSGAVSTVW